ncbi:MAG TPA: type II toxin-antitoxin system HipA family toxin [Gammaproteobacteria bacterium]|nr:type II toxin-antitoxin system HipA family toxin [Gammaproteobacteria bacterium]
MKNTNIVNVSYMHGNKKLAMGRLALKDRKIFFEYNPEFIVTGLELSPFKLPLQPGIFFCEDQIFDGLFGIFNDSLPDGWGRLLLDRKLMQLGINPNVLSPLDRLRYVGSNGMGALIYEPEISDISTSHNTDLDQIHNEILAFQANNDVEYIDDLIKMNGSSAGARPKVMLNLSGSEWLIKFRNSADPQDAGPIEYAYHLMAKAANLNVPEARLFSSKNNLGYFGVKRFDRVAGKRLHMHTVSGLLHADFRIPSLDYMAIIQSTLWLTKDIRECKHQFRAAVFNVLTHNRDDHARNFSFLMNEQGIWQVSPSYDLNFSSGPAGEHSTTIMHEGKFPKIGHLLLLAEIGQVDKANALQIIDEVRTAVDMWPKFAQESGVLATSEKTIHMAMQRINKTLFASAP